MKTKRKLPPHQYSLRLPAPYKEPVVHKNLPHMVFYNGQWHLFRSRWKSRFRVAPYIAAQIVEPTVADIKRRLNKQRDYRFGYVGTSNAR